jgi:hypothetical protein
LKPEQHAIGSGFDRTDLFEKALYFGSSGREF